MKVGIYLGYGPNTLMHKEGLGRYSATLIKGLTERGHQVTVAMPKWLIGSFELLLEEFEINSEKLNYVIEYKTPVIWELYTKSHIQKRGRGRFKRKVLGSSLKMGERLLDMLLSASDIVPIFLGGMIFIVCSIIALPFIAAIAILYILSSLLVKFIRREKVNIQEYATRIIDILKNAKGAGFDIYSYLFQKMLTSVQNKLVDRINLMNNPVDVWYSPSIFWPCFNQINGKKVINVPDLVVMDYPMHWYDRYGVIESSLRCEETIVNGTLFITYCQFIKEDLLIKRYGKQEKNITVIPHMVNDMSQYVTMDVPPLIWEVGMKKNFTQSFCRSLLSQTKGNVLQVQDYISDFDMRNVRYIFYSSQARPHKNLLNLLKAYLYILRKEYCGIKLFLTGDIYQFEDLKCFIKENELQYDVLCFYNVSAQQLAALYHEAELVVNPTLYEGGFPFTFGEGMSVGTPSLMSDIPQVREVFGTDLEECTFDPYNYQDMAKKIVWGVNNKEKLYNMQLPLFERMCSRGVDKYVEEYIEAFRKAV